MPDTPQSIHPFALGFVARPAARQLAIDLGRYCRIVDPTAPVPPAYSLSQFRTRHVEQGQAGTCWAHAGAMDAEVSALALGYESFPVCRRLVGWAGKQLEGGGNPSNGGDPTDALLSMVESKGVGIAHEALCPYTDDSRTLGTKPSQNVFDDAKKSWGIAIVEVTSDDDARQMIYHGQAVANGIWWPYGWDNQKTFMDTIGTGTYGHALLEIGYAQPGIFDQFAWFQFDNWHGLLYPPLPTALASKVPGYKPISFDRTSDFWVRADIYERVRGYGNAVRVGLTDFQGIRKTIVSKPGFLEGGWIGAPGSEWAII